MYFKKFLRKKEIKNSIIEFSNIKQKEDTSVFSLGKNKYSIVFELNYGEKESFFNLKNYILDYPRFNDLCLEFKIIKVKEEKTFEFKTKRNDSINLRNLINSQSKEKYNEISFYIFINITTENKIELEQIIFDLSKIMNKNPLTKIELLKESIDIALDKKTEEEEINFEITHLTKVEKELDPLIFKGPNDTLYSMDIFKSKMNNNSLIVSGGNTDNIEFSKNLLINYLRSNTKVYITDKKYNDFTTLKNFFDTKIIKFNKNLSLNLFSLSKDSDLIRNNYSYIIFEIIKIEEYNEFEQLILKNQIQKAINISYNLYKNKNNLIKVIKELKNILEKKYHSDILCKLEPFINKKSKYYNLFNGKFNTELSKQLTILEEYNSEITSILKISLDISILEKHSKYTEKNIPIEGFIIYKNEINNSSKNEIDFINMISRRVRLYRGSLILSIQTIFKNNKNAKEISDLFLNFSFKFLLQNNCPSNNIIDFFSNYKNIQNNLASGTNNKIPDIAILDSEDLFIGKKILIEKYWKESKKDLK